ncbi:MAG: SDR family oxidoreductase [Isosphaeraceae bacterium]
MSKTEMALVTGGAGFIGSHLVDGLLAEGLRVRVLDNLSTGHRSNLAHLEGRFEFVEGDLASFETCASAVAGVDYVFHQGAIPSVPRSVRDPIESHVSGPTATLNILEASRQVGVKRLMFAASSSAYGDTVELPKHEDMLPTPLSPYAAGKLAGEHYVTVYARTMGLDGVSLRYFNIFGPRQDPSSPYSGVISLFIRFMSQGQRPTIFGDGQQTRDFTFVSNVVAANLAAMRAKRPLNGEVFNVGIGRRISLLDLIDSLNRILGTKLEPILADPRQGDVKDSLASLDRIRQVLGYEPVVDFEEGLRRTVESVVG